MEEIAALYPVAVAHFDRLVRAVGPDGWTAPSPNPGWDVRALVGHVTYEARWSVPLLAGSTVAEVGDRYEGDLLGDDPVAAWSAAAADAVEAAAEPGALERTVHLSFGDVPGSEYAHQLAAEYLVHGWDLARSIAADDGADERLVALVAAWFPTIAELYRGAGVTAAEVAVGDDADAWTRLLADFGRQRTP